MSDYFYKPDAVAFDTDLYGLLQVDQSAEPEVIKAAHKVLMVKYGVRLSDADNELSRQLNSARDILLSVDKRKAYDQHRKSNAEKTFGNYLLVKELAKGGAHTDIYLGKHILTGAPAVIKHCWDLGLDYQNILISEGKILSEIRHFAIPKFRDIFRLEDGSMVLVEDYIPGPTLEEFVIGIGALDAEYCCWIAGRHLQIVKYLHYHGVVHGDIKPKNSILWPDEHQAFLVDFGLAMMKPKPDEKNFGSVEIYSAPEQSLPSRPRLIPANDYYSLGMLLIFMLTGDHKFAEQKRIPKSTPEPLVEFIRWLTKTDPTERPNGMTEDLEEHLRQIRLKSFGRDRSNFSGYKNWRQKLGL